MYVCPRFKSRTSHLWPTLIFTHHCNNMGPYWLATLTWLSGYGCKIYACPGFKSQASHSWPSSPPHWLSQKRNRANMKAPILSYFIDFNGLYWPGGLMVSMLAWLDGFSWVLVSFVFNSWCMYIFCGALTLLLYEFLVTFYFLLVFYFSLCSSLNFTWH